MPGKWLINHWKRHLFYVVLAVAIWMGVDRSLTATKTIAHVTIRVENLPADRIIEGISSGGRLHRKINLTVVGNREFIDALQPSDLEVVIDARGKPEEWDVLVGKRDLVPLNPNIDLSSGISRVSHPHLHLHLSKMVTEVLSIAVARPLGDPPRGYQFVDVWPYQLQLTVSGPAEAIQKVKQRDLHLTFNLNEISKKQLDAILPAEDSNGEIVSLYVPEKWKYIHLPQLG